METWLVSDGCDRHGMENGKWRMENGNHGKELWGHPGTRAGGKTKCVGKVSPSIYRQKLKLLEPKSLDGWGL